MIDPNTVPHLVEPEDTVAEIEQIEQMSLESILSLYSLRNSVDMQTRILSSQIMKIS